MGFISPIPTDSNGQTRTTESMKSMGKDDFLQLLVAKLEHQDPLSPMEDEDFIAQLAQFSALEQMQNIADGIETSNQWDFLQMQSINNMMASGLIGKEVTADFSGVYLDSSNEPVISYNLQDHARSVEIEIRNASGDLVATITTEDPDLGANSIKWDGKDNLGNRADEGYYTVSAKAVDEAGHSFEPGLSLVGIVSTITYRDGAAYVTIDGTEVALGDLKSVGQPTSEDD